ncbi:hypothetical protein T484DRAFT_1815126 [Baffinella frigidus]|nr:hypothetical protein T484DRAFT_1815126 [Cryptophyta sp. CCMP2293]
MVRNRSGRTALMGEPPSGRTALMGAAFGGHAASVRLLVDSGGKPDLQDHDGITS